MKFLIPLPIQEPHGLSGVWVSEADSPRQMPRRGISGLFLPITGFPFGETLFKDIEVHISHAKIDALIVRIIVHVRYNPAALYAAAGIRPGMQYTFSFHTG